MRPRNDIDSAYFEWLCSKVDRRATKSTALLSDLHSIEFYWHIQGDENRAVDGTKLRECFGMETKFHNAEDYLEGACSLLEMLIALSQRMEYQLYDPNNRDREAQWFWLLIDNLGLSKIDPSSRDAQRNRRRNSRIINKFLEREYARDGTGGLFPMKRTNKDQRKIEIWYQMMEYVSAMIL